MEKDVTTTSLEILSPRDLRAKIPNGKDIFVNKVEIPTPSLNHYFFVNVGRPWKWYSRLPWTFSDWRMWVEKDHVHTFVGYAKGAPFGYIELDRRPEGVEIAFFGLLPQFIGYGLGGFLLSEAIRLAWSLDTDRVWVHTCTLDHKHALANYQARGMSIFRQATMCERIPDDDDPIWTTPAFYRSMAEEYRKVGDQNAE